MYTAKIENSNGQIMILTGNEPVYQVISILGLNPPPAQINTTTAAGIDGTRYNSSRLNSRNIVITIKINGDVETNRQTLYRFFRTKEWCRFYYANRHRDVYIDGYVEAVNCDLFVNDERAQISIICPQPYFKDFETVTDDVSNVVAAFKFPFSINIGNPIPISSFDNLGTATVINDSEVAVGVIIDVTFAGAVDELELLNTNTGEHLTLAYPFVESDRVTIDTTKGNKSVRLFRDGETINIFPAVQRGSVFLQLAVGDNQFAYLADGGERNTLVSVIFSHANMYRGV